MGHFKHQIMALASIFNFIMPVSMAINSSCDYYQQMIIGQTYYIYNTEYPSYYGRSTSCRWKAISETGTRIVITCSDIDIPTSKECNGDRLSISLSGTDNFSDSQNYCGTGTLSLVSPGNALTVGLFSTSTSLGGKFSCSLIAIQDTASTSTETPNVCDCGWKQGTRIVGGEETGINEFPSMAGLIESSTREVYCGSSIISARYVVSAAHCVYNRLASNIGVLVGDHNTTTGLDTPTAALYKVSAYEIHPDYNPTTFVNDISLLQTERTITFSLYVGPICLPFRYTSFDFTGQNVTTLGWGQLFFSGPTSDTLMKVDLTIISNAECNAKENVNSDQLCTFTPGKDTCQYDSGGPLIWQDTSTRRLQLLGIISYGLACASGRPSVNTRVTSYLSWIVSRTTDATYCIK